MKHCASVLALLIATPLFAIPPASGPRQETPPRLVREDFARGLLLTPNSTDAVQTLLLPEAVYRTLSDSRMGDLRVYNAAGEEVPHALRSLMDAKRIEHADVELPLFPLRGDTLDSSDLGDITLQLKRSADGRVIQLTEKSAAQAAGAYPGPPILAHLLDLGSLARPAVALSFQLPEVPESFLCTFTIEASQDLAKWSTLVPEASLASLDREGTRLERKRVLLPPTSQPFLRVRWLKQAPPLPLHKVTLELSSESGVPARRSVRLVGTKSAAEANAYNFESPGTLPINRVQVELPDNNTLIQAALKARDTESSPWRTVLDQRFFRIKNGVELHNDPYRIPTHVAKHWALYVDPQGGGLGAGMPTLQLEYFPHQLAFVARGNGPFTLAYGKANADPASFDWSTVTQLLSQEQKSALTEQTVTLGDSFQLAGPAALTIPKEDRRLQQAALWLVLILAVAMLGGYSWKLLRKLPAPDSAA